jgi:hypothetical protein
MKLHRCLDFTIEPFASDMAEQLVTVMDQLEGRADVRILALLIGSRSGPERIDLQPEG